MKKLSVIVLLTTLLISGCATTKVDIPELNKVFVTNSKRVDLLPVSAMIKSIDECSYFEGAFRDKTFSALAYITADNTGITLLLLNEFGIEIGSVIYNGTTAQLDSQLFSKKAKCEYLLLDIQNIYCDAQRLKEHYSKYGINFSYCDTERTICKNKKVIEKIQYSDDKIVLTNFIRNYSYTLIKP